MTYFSAFMEPAIYTRSVRAYVSVTEFYVLRASSELSETVVHLFICQPSDYDRFRPHFTVFWFKTGLPIFVTYTRIFHQFYGCNLREYITPVGYTRLFPVGLRQSLMIFYVSCVPNTTFSRFSKIRATGFRNGRQLLFHRLGPPNLVETITP